MKMTWGDIQIIAEKSDDNYPDIEPQWVQHTDIHTWICGLDGFYSNPKKTNEKILKAVQMAYIEEMDD